MSEDAETKATLRVEYEKVGMLEGTSVNLRFVTLGTFAALNGFLFTAYGYILTSPSAFSRLLLSFLAAALLGINIVFLLLERRTSHGMQRLWEHGVTVGTALDLPNNIYSKTLTSRTEIITHEKILTGLYGAMAVISLIGGLIIAGWWPAPPKEKNELAEFVRTFTPAAIESQMRKVGDEITDNLIREIQILREQHDARFSRIERSLQESNERITRLENAVRTKSGDKK